MIRLRICPSAGCVDPELLRAQISERRVEPALVLDLLDEVRKMFDDVLEVVEGHRIECLDLHRLRDALRFGVVVWMPLHPIEPNASSGHKRVQKQSNPS
jgi:hypothetical protein